MSADAQPLAPMLLAASRYAEQIGLQTLRQNLRGIAEALSASTYGELFTERDADRLANLLRGVLLVLSDPPAHPTPDQISVLRYNLREAIRTADRLAQPARIAREVNAETARMARELKPT